MDVDAAADRLGQHHPLAYRLLRPPWRLLMRARGTPTYWDGRSHYRYYREVELLARAYEPGGQAVLDVGAHEARLLDRLDWFERRIALDTRYVMARRGIETVQGDYLAYEPQLRFDLVLCLQVLEHLEHPAPFARKLLREGRTVIVSVPHRWPANAHLAHRHDPVDEAKLRGWIGEEPLETRTVDDGKERLIAVYRSDDRLGRSASERVACQSHQKPSGLAPVVSK
jgi:SAM-dependent methyltransferase